MSSEKIMDAISGISDKYIEKYAVVEPVKHDKLNRIVIQRRWVYKLSACLTVIAIAVGIGITALISQAPPSPNEEIWLQNDTVPISSVNISSYILSETGSVIELKLSDSGKTPISIIDAGDHLRGLLFSVDASTQKAPPVLTVFSAGSCEQKSCELYEISGLEFHPGKLYFFFEGENKSDFENIVIYYSDEETAASFEISIKVSETDSGYFAELQSISFFLPEKEP